MPPTCEKRMDSISATGWPNHNGNYQLPWLWMQHSPGLEIKNVCDHGIVLWPFGNVYCKKSSKKHLLKSWSPKTSACFVEGWLPQNASKFCCPFSHCKCIKMAPTLFNWGCLISYLGMPSQTNMVLNGHGAFWILDHLGGYFILNFILVTSLKCEYIWGCKNMCLHYTHQETFMAN